MLRQSLRSVCPADGRKRRRQSFPAPGTRSPGFTLTELMISIAILLTVFAMAIPSALSAITSGKNARAVGDIRAIGDDCYAYDISNGQWPNTLADVKDDFRMDPWQDAYKYLNLSGGNISGARLNRFLFPFNTYFDLYSEGADRQSELSLTAPQSQDDIIWALDGDYVGLVATYEDFED